jgi:MarR family transcriptional regulator for hemolysin
MISDKEKYAFESMPLGKKMARITKSYYGALSKRVEPLGIDRHFATLVTIEDTDKKCTQQYLSNLLNLDKVTMVRILDYLFEKGMVTREVNLNDRREHFIQLTAKAKKLMPGIRNEIIGMNKIALNGLNKKEQELFREFLDKIIKNLENLPVNKVDIKIKKK